MSPEGERPAPNVREVREFLVTRIAEWLDCPPSNVDTRSSFMQLGLDSLEAVSLSGDLEQWLQRRLPPDLLLRFTTVSTLAMALANGDALAGAPDAAADASDWTSAPGRTYRPAYNQERSLALDECVPGGRPFLVSGCFHTDATLDPQRLESCLQRVVDRHEALNTTFERDGDVFRAVVRPGARAPLEVHSLESEDLSSFEWKVEALTRAQLQRPFDLRRSPLFRMMMVQAPKGRTMLQPVFHHSVADGHSMMLLMAELVACYNDDSERALPVERAPFSQHAEQERRRWEGAPDLDSRVNRWLGRLGGAEMKIRFYDADGDAEGSETIHALGRLVGLPLAQRLRSVASDHGVTRSTLLLTLYLELLHEHTGQKNLIICGPLANRHRPEFRDTVGYFNNIVFYYSHRSRGTPFFEHLRRVNSEVRIATLHGDLPLAEFIARAHRNRYREITQLTNVQFNYLPHLPDLSIAGQSLSPRLDVPLDVLDDWYDLVLYVLELPRGLLFHWVSRGKRLGRKRLEHFADRMADRLEGLCADELPVAGDSVRKTPTPRP